MFKDITKRHTVSRNRKAQERTRVKPRRSTAGRPRGRPGRKASLTQRLASERERKENKLAGRSFKTLKKQAFSLLKRSEVEELARECGFYRRTPRAISAFDFALCCAMAAMVEGKRGFASVWRLLAAAVGVKVARSAVTQRFGERLRAVAGRTVHQSSQTLAEDAMPGHARQTEEVPRGAGG